MAISKLFKKTTAPDELPDLAIDELKKELKKDYSEKEETKTEEKKEEVLKEGKIEENQDNPIEEEKKEEVLEEGKIEENQDNPIEEEKPVEKTITIEKSFFNPLLNELKKENFDPAKINSWYEKSFSGKDTIEGMKEFWEKQKNEFITEAVKKEFKARINEGMNRLQKLEAEWQELETERQETHINLIKKEEEMKEEQENIKRIIKDFSEVVKKKGNIKKDGKNIKKAKKDFSEVVKKKGNIKKEHKSK